MNKKEAIKLVKSQYNIVDYISTNGVNLEPSSGNSFKGLCPFHNEKTPSFVVSEDFQNYRCFGCGERGDIINFAEKMHTIDNDGALKLLAEEKGIKIDVTTSESKHDINGIKRVLEDAAIFYRNEFKKLPDNHPAKLEITSRKLKLDNPIYGFSPEKPNELYKHLIAQGHSPENVRDSKLVVFFDEPDRKPWDFFHGRLMVTLADYMGKPVSFTSRRIFDSDKMTAKYINGKESPIFFKKNNLFGADSAKTEARAKKKVIVVEGQFDREAMYEYGIKNVVGASGTAFTEQHANILLRMVGESGAVVFLMDGDSAGIESALKIFNSVPILHSNSYAALLDDGKDPCDYIKEGRLEELEKKIDEAMTLDSFVFEVLKKKLGGVINESNRHNFVSEVCMYAKASNSKHVIQSLLSKASIISAYSIESVMEIYNKTNFKGENKRREKEKEEKTDSNSEENKLLIPMDAKNEADMCMYHALSFLVRMPEELIPVTPKNYHEKFKTFMFELGNRYVYYKKNGVKWRFVKEDYSDQAFAQALINKEFMFDPLEDVKDSISQYTFLFEKANSLYDYERKLMLKSQALSSIAGTTDAKKISEALSMYADNQNQV